MNENKNDTSSDQIIDPSESILIQEEFNPEESSSEKSNPKTDQSYSPKKLYRLHGGMVELPDGTLTKSKMMDVFGIPLDDYSDIRLTQSEMRRIRWHAEKMKYGFQAMAPILCLGPVKCIFRLRCPIIDRSITTANGEIDFAKQDAKKFPLARQCFVEGDFLTWKRQAYIDEFEIDIESPTELGMVNKLAELDLYEYRATLVLAHGDSDGEGMNLMKNQVTGATVRGDEITRLEEHPAFILKDKLHRQRMDILNALVGTRKEKYKKEVAMKQRDFKDPSSIQSDLRTRLEGLGNGSIIDVDFKESETKTEVTDKSNTNE